MRLTSVQTILILLVSLLLIFVITNNDMKNEKNILQQTQNAQKQVGILYEVWHGFASQNMKKIQQKGGLQLTTEKVIQSEGKYVLDDVLKKYGLNGDIWNVKPKNLGFYCIFRKRANDTSPLMEDCDNIEQVAENHAKLLTEAGFDYVSVDITNWPVMDKMVDTWVVRPTEVLFEEWQKLRQRGIKTPQITIWPCSPANSNTWQIMLDSLYNSGKFDDLIYKIDGKKVVFLPDNPSCYEANEEKKIISNGGRNDIKTIKMWALFGQDSYNKGSWGFFTPCTDLHNHYSTSIANQFNCNQYTTLDSKGKQLEITASGSYMLSQSSLPFAAAGKFRGLTTSKLFQKILDNKPDFVFFSSFNEHIGGRQDPAYDSNIAFNMGLPKDSQRFSVWVDTYGSEFSRDIEPTEEGGDIVYQVTKACVQMYKNGQNCNEQPKNLCCSKEDKYVFKNVWSLKTKDGRDHLLTIDENEKGILVRNGWQEVCVPINGPSDFCVNTAQKDGRDGPFIIYSVKQENSIPLYRCIIKINNQHFFSTDSKCEGQTTESQLGFISTKRGGETLRALRRCLTDQGQHLHSLDLECDHPDTPIFGYVR